jgi:hypothetical protein
MAVFKNSRRVTGAICKGLKSGLSLEIKEWFFTWEPARRMPQGGEKPASASSLTNFKSIRYRGMPERVPVSSAPETRSAA